MTVQDVLIPFARTGRYRRSAHHCSTGGRHRAVGAPVGAGFLDRSRRAAVSVRVRLPEGRHLPGPLPADQTRFGRLRESITLLRAARRHRTPPGNAWTSPAQRCCNRPPMTASNRPARCRPTAPKMWSRLSARRRADGTCSSRATRAIATERDDASWEPSADGSHDVWINGRGSRLSRGPLGPTERRLPGATAVPLPFHSQLLWPLERCLGWRWPGVCRAVPCAGCGAAIGASVLGCWGW